MFNYCGMYTYFFPSLQCIARIKFHARIYLSKHFLGKHVKYVLGLVKYEWKNIFKFKKYYFGF